MRCLLDTHALAWWLLDDPLLGNKAKDIISDRKNEIFVSAVSAFEMANKLRAGKWFRIETIVADFENIIVAENFAMAEISIRHSLIAGQLISAHKDPFDRLLAAQCKVEGLSLITADAAFRTFAIDIVW